MHRPVGVVGGVFMEQDKTILEVGITYLSRAASGSTNEVTPIKLSGKKSNYEPARRAARGNPSEIAE